MTDRNTEIMRDAFRLLNAFEKVPDDDNIEYWQRLGEQAQAMYNRWNGDPIASKVAMGIIEGLTDIWHRKNRGKIAPLTII